MLNLNEMYCMKNEFNCDSGRVGRIFFFAIYAILLLFFVHRRISEYIRVYVIACFPLGCGWTTNLFYLAIGFVRQYAISKNYISISHQYEPCGLYIRATNVPGDRSFNNASIELFKKRRKENQPFKCKKSISNF